MTVETLLLDARKQADIERAGALVREGGLAVFPTETVYGLGANAFDGSAADSIFAAKGRPSDNPLIVHVADVDAVALVAREIPEPAAALFAAFSPGPLTVILPKQLRIALSVTAGLDTVGVRIPAMPEARAFLRACGVPVAAPSANRSGLPSPTNFEMAREAMDGRVAAILDGPASTLGLESTIVYPQPSADGTWRVHILRPGSVSPDAIARALVDAGIRATVIEKSSPKNGPDDSLDPGEVRAPGTRYRHYSPRASVRLFSTTDELEKLLAEPLPNPIVLSGTPGIMILSLAGMMDASILVESLEHRGIARSVRVGRSEPEPASSLRAVHTLIFDDIESYARELYRALFEADKLGVDLILAWTPPRVGLGIALSDRLGRAAGLV